MNKGKKIRPWVKVSIAFIIGVAITSQIFKLTSTDASENEEKKIIKDALHGVVEITMDGKAYLTMIDEQIGFGAVEVKDDSYYKGDVVTVIYDSKGNITNSFISTDTEIKSLRNQYGATYRALLEKHGRYKE